MSATSGRPEREAHSAIDQVFRHEWGRVVAALARAFGNLDLAEDATQEAFTTAATTWPATGVPPNPGGWLTTTARRRAIDRLRRDAVGEAKQHLALGLSPNFVSPAVDEGRDSVEDDLLRLIFTCCHPAIEPSSQVALTLRLVAGLSTGQIARAFLVSESTLAQRLVRTKRKIRAANVPFRMPNDAELPERLAPVLAVVIQIFNEGYLPTTGPDLQAPELCEEAIHLARTLAQLMPDEPEVRGLLAWMLLMFSRRKARVGVDGSLMLLAHQDRARWDRDLIAEGQALVRDCHRQDRPGPYQIHAAINAVHSDAPTVEQTDWNQIVMLYDQLLAVMPTPVVALNRAVAVAEVEGPQTALRLVDQLPLDRYHLWHATRGELLRRCGNLVDSIDAFQRAAMLATNDAERRFIEGRIVRLDLDSACIGRQPQ